MEALGGLIRKDGMMLRKGKFGLNNGENLSERELYGAEALFPGAGEEPHCLGCLKLRLDAD